MINGAPGLNAKSTANAMTPFILYSVLLIYVQISNCNVSVTAKEKFDENKVCAPNLVHGKRNACVEKCCPHNMYVVRVLRMSKSKFKLHCKEYNNPNETLDFTDMKIYDEDRTKVISSVNKTLYIIPNKFKNETFRMNAMDYTKLARVYNENIYLTERGNFYREKPNFYDRWHRYDAMTFCIDYFMDHPEQKPSPHIWINDDKNTDIENTPIKFYQIYGDLLTSFFLLLVFVVYILLPNLRRNLGGKIIMAYVFCLFWAYVLLYINQNHQMNHCHVLALVTYFFFMTSFCWMNVMSIDIWWTFRSYAKSHSNGRREDRKRFIIYCLYACGVPLAMTIAVSILDKLDLHRMPWFVLPNIGASSCFLDGGSKFLYLYIPMTILISMNWLFFLMTAFNVWRLSRGTKVLDLSNSSSTVGQRKQWARFMVYLKLSIVMGLSWVFEILSYKLPGYVIWQITDIYNLFIGLAMFIIFVAKKKIYKQLKSRFETCGKNIDRNRSTQSTKNVTSNFIINDTSEPTVTFSCDNLSKRI